MNDIVLPRVTIHVGDCLESLRAMEAESVHCCVTSPPYWGLRDYGTADWEGGEEGCDHDQRRRENDPSSKSATNAGQARDSVAGNGRCRKCGARRVDRQIGLEQTPAEYVAKMVDVFREVRRVLRKDGTCWINLGDSYAGSVALTTNEKALKGKQGTSRGTHGNIGWRNIQHDSKPKDLVGIPWRVAFALQADGWWLRQDIVWSKPNPMPESVTDRCTKAHEYIFLLAKSERYYYDAQAIAEKAMHAPSQEWVGGRRTVAGDSLQQVHPAGSCHTLGDGITRNKRSVWTVATQPYPEAHFATYPPKLIEPCILAGCPADGTVLDPFGGSGTTAAVAVKHGRSAVLCELNPAYAQLAERRVREQLDGVGLFVGE